MKITIDHPASSYGLPVILDDDGSVMDYALAIKVIRTRLNMSTADLARHCGGSHRSVEKWEQGRMPSAQALNAMSTLPIQ